MEFQRYDIMRWEMFQTVSRYVDVSEKVLSFAIYQIEIMILYLKQFIHIFIKLKDFHLITNYSDTYGWISILFSYNATPLIPSYDL